LLDPVCLGQQLLQLGVLLLEPPQPPGVGDLHPAVLGLPFVEGGVADAVLVTHLKRLRSCLLLPQDRNNLLLAEPATRPPTRVSGRTLLKSGRVSRGSGHDGPAIAQQVAQASGHASAARGPVNANRGQPGVDDFVHDQLFDGRKIRILTIVHAFTRLSPAIDVRPHFRGSDVVDTLERVWLPKDNPARQWPGICQQRAQSIGLHARRHARLQPARQAYRQGVHRELERQVPG